jgi:SAM-dependent methyltransferase
MIDRDRKEVEASEIAFFANYYENTAYNLTGWRLRLNRELHSLRRVLGNQKPKRVLSIGCGDGAFEIQLAPFAEHITALDLSPQAIQVAQQTAAKAKVTHVDFRCLSFADLAWNEKFDVIICLAFLHHVREPDLPDFLKQVYTHLEPGGFFYSQDPSIHGVLRKIGRVLLGSNYDKYHSPDERELDPAELKLLLKSAGFSTVEIDYIDLTLIPMLYILTTGPDWPLYLCAGLDWLWCRSPVARWASGFKAISRK